jgi:hypothetical protein
VTANVAKSFGLDQVLELADMHAQSGLALTFASGGQVTLNDSASELIAQLLRVAAIGALTLRDASNGRGLTNGLVIAAEIELQKRFT